ncbi:hypothetical protein RBH29_02780 [Herbivorax sp. ANBcel31]|uniref:hypothetical protein n=1 Tax=Herbivorax sp. ANBcel31 TaxID=3069754 RepID=UPI0027AE6229|nr:hypothetical protein [Herbivorax sp. ANBcel31]MDQ2085363.1 hypothetical protein [Herbivorax sp. ANBcel31]
MTLLACKKLFRVNLAVMLIDDFTDSCIYGSGFTLSIKDTNINPLRKNDGFYVFTNLPSNQIQIMVKSSKYIDEIFNINTESLQASSPVVKIRLKPNVNYNLSTTCTAVTGVIRSSNNNPLDGVNIKVVPHNQSSDYKIVKIKKLKDKNLITLYSSGSKNLEGKTFLICDKKSDKKEYFTLLESFDNNNTFILKEPLTHEYNKNDAYILKVYSTRTDKNGQFLMPLDFKIDNNKEIILEAEYNSRVISREFEISKNIRNKIGTITF